MAQSFNQISSSVQRGSYEKKNIKEWLRRKLKQKKTRQNTAKDILEPFGLTMDTSGSFLLLETQSNPRDEKIKRRKNSTKKKRKKKKK